MRLTLTYHKLNTHLPWVERSLKMNWTLTESQWSPRYELILDSVDARLNSKEWSNILSMILSKGINEADNSFNESLFTAVSLIETSGRSLAPFQSISNLSVFEWLSGEKNINLAVWETGTLNINQTFLFKSKKKKPRYFTPSYKIMCLDMARDLVRVHSDFKSTRKFTWFKACFTARVMGTQRTRKSWFLCYHLRSCQCHK